jgi:hypothetical protein
VSALLVGKNPAVLGELAAADPRLQVVVYYAAALAFERYGIVPVVTRVNGTRAQTIEFHGSGAPLSPHEVRPTRATDLRTRGMLTDVQAQEWEDLINKRIEYNPAGAAVRHPVALFETQEKMLAKGRDPALPPLIPHLHLQVPPWTSKGSAPMVRLWSFGVGATA